MGFFALMGALRGFQLIGIGGEENLLRAASLFDNAALAIGWAVLFDMLDGRIARMTRTTTEIGVQFDSIADVVTFGIAPAVLIYAWSYGAIFADGSNGHKLGWFLSFMYVVCGGFRLARFNVQATRPRPLAEGTVKLDKKSFVGLPIPAAAALIAALIHFNPSPLTIPVFHLDVISLGVSIMALLAVLSFLMVSNLRYTSFKSVGTGRRSTRLAILLVAAAGMLIYLFSQYVLLIISVIYILHPLVLRLFSSIRPRATTVSP
jgi:CDP-diacylglycerol--serine O-phosphatidyltransferase